MVIVDMVLAAPPKWIVRDDRKDQSAHIDVETASEQQDVDVKTEGLFDIPDEKSDGQSNENIQKNRGLTPKKLRWNWRVFENRTGLVLEL